MYVRPRFGFRHLYYLTALVSTIAAALAVTQCSSAHAATGPLARASTAAATLTAAGATVADTGLRCILHADPQSARVDSCTAVQPPAPPPPAPPPPAPPPAPAPAPAPAPPPNVLVCGRSDYLRAVKVSTAAELRAALVGAKPGDAISMADGVYSGSTGEIRVRVAGSPSARISLCGSANAVLDAGNLTSTTSLSVVGGAYWTFSGFTITDGLFGIYAENSDHLVIDHVQIHAIGQEAISLKKASHHSVVQNCTIYDTGRTVAEYGEGVYIGTANSQWVNGVPDKTDSVLVTRCTFGPNVRAEAIDVKEATTGTRIIANTFDGSGEVESQGSGESGWPNSPVILQGLNAHVDSNTVTHPLVAAFRVVTHGTVMTGSGNTFSANTVDAGGARYGFLIQAGTLTSTNVVKCSNSVKNASKGASNIACSP